LAQPATYLLLALPLSQLGSWLERLRDWRIARRSANSEQLPSPLASRLSQLAIILLLVIIARRDLPDYFVEWPQRGLVRFLYRADYADIADYLNTHRNLTDFGVTSLLAGPWDKVALAIDLETAVHPRWYNPERVLLVQPPLSFYGFPQANTAFADTYKPDEVRLGDYRLGTVQVTLDMGDPICFQNGLCVLTAGYTSATQHLNLIWQLRRPLTLPLIPLISNPPPPGVYAGPRLSVFSHLLSSDGQFLTGDDGLWIDPTTLQEGDIFIQQHKLPSPTAGQTIVFGLYDPKTGERIVTEDGRDSVTVELGE
jgi:hypothetical protein